jgi:hypothetical protein
LLGNREGGDALGSSIPALLSGTRLPSESAELPFSPLPSARQQQTLAFDHGRRNFPPFAAIRRPILTNLKMKALGPKTHGLPSRADPAGLRTLPARKGVQRSQRQGGEEEVPTREKVATRAPFQNYDTPQNHLIAFRALLDEIERDGRYQPIGTRPDGNCVLIAASLGALASPHATPFSALCKMVLRQGALSTSPSDERYTTFIRQLRAAIAEQISKTSKSVGSSMPANIRTPYRSLGLAETDAFLAAYPLPAISSAPELVGISPKTAPFFLVTNSNHAWLFFAPSVVDVGELRKLSRWLPVYHESFAHIRGCVASGRPWGHYEETKRFFRVAPTKPVILPPPAPVPLPQTVDSPAPPKRGRPRKQPPSPQVPTMLASPSNSTGQTLSSRPLADPLPQAVSTPMSSPTTPACGPATACTARDMSLGAPSSSTLNPRVICCPVTGCDKQVKYWSGLNKHISSLHPGAVITDHMLAGMDAVKCPHCPHIGRREADGSIPRHKGCVDQSQLNISDQARREFARRGQELRGRQHDDLVESYIAMETVNEAELETPLARRQHAETLRQCLREYTVQQDPYRRAAIGTGILNNPLQVPSRRLPPSRVRIDDVTHHSNCIRRAITILNTSGQLGKAVRSLRSTRPFPVNEETRPNVIALFPPARQPLVRPCELEAEKYDFKVDPELLAEILEEKDATTGRGLSNVGFGELKPILKDDEAFKGLTMLIEDFLNDRFAHDSTFSRQLRDWKCVLLEKGNGDPRPRPICVPEVIRSLAGTVQARQYLPKLCPTLDPQSYGVGVRDGCARAALIAQTHFSEAIRTGESLYIILVDVSNMYGNLSRALVLQLLDSLHPQLVKAFLAGYAGSSFANLPDLTLEFGEGVAQGDPMAPLYAQLVMDHLLKPLRERFPSLVALASVLDDVHIIDRDLDVALAAFANVREELEKIGLPLNLQKCKILSAQGLDEPQTDVIGEARLQIATEGVVLLGTPIGSEIFIRDHLESAASEAIELLHLIAECDTLGKLNRDFASPQGLYHVVRDCVNQMHRHLLRTVDPALTAPAFRALDATTIGTVGRIFDIAATDMNDLVKMRLTLPGRYSGLGLSRYEDIAPAAYLGCINANGRALRDHFEEHGISITGIPGLAAAHESMTATLALLGGDPEDQPLPALEHILDPIPRTSPEPTEVPMTRRKRKKRRWTNPLDEATERGGNLQRRLTWKVHALRRKRLDDLARSDWDKFILTVTANPTAPDFLYVRISNPGNRMRHTFKTSVRLFLGLPVSSGRCNIGGCVDVSIARNGQHSHHARLAIHKRHNRVRDAIGHAFRLLFTSGVSDYTVEYEAFLDDLGYARKETAPRDERLRCDVVLEHGFTGHKFVTDVSITHPDHTQSATRTEMLCSATKRASGKVAQYVAMYEIDQADVVPLVFETYGGYAPATFEFLQRISLIIARNDSDKAGFFFRRLRDRIAVALHKGQFQVISQLNSLNQVLGWKR